MPQVTFCTQCGTELPAESVFCSRCGTRLASGTMPRAVPQPPMPIAPTSVRYNPRNGLFAGTLPLMVRLAIRAINDIGYKVGDVNEVVGIVQFETGMSMGSWSGISGTLTIEDRGESVFAVGGAAKQNVRGGQLLALDFGESKRKAEKVIRRMADLAR